VENFLASYGSVEKTLARLKEIYIFKHTRNRIKVVCKNCHICLRRNKIPKTIPLALGKTDKPMYPFRIVSIDTAGPLPPTLNTAGAPAPHKVIIF